jgi:exodeoxyribonuclease-3
MFYDDGRVTEINFQVVQNPLPVGEYPKSTSFGASPLSGGITLLNVYFPNGGMRADGTEMLTYKLKFYDCLIEYIKYKRASGRKVIVVGDYNICHTEIDIARPKENQDSIGFLPIERSKVSEFLHDADMVDVFRYFHPDKTDEYTWWSYRA